MKNESISLQAARSSIWTAVEKFSTLGIQFIVSLVLARLLLPSHYGMVAMLSVFIGIANEIVSCGVGNAIIRKKDCKSVDYSTAFYFNISLGIIMYFVIYIISPLVSSFYKMEILCSLLRLTGLTLVINSFSIVQNAIISKELQVEKRAIISILAVVVSGTIGILMAFYGFGVWALAWQTIISSLLTCALLWILTGWKPQCMFSYISFKYLWDFGSKMLLTGIISSLYRNIYSIIIGKIYNPSSLGFFNRGQSLGSIFQGISEKVFMSNSLAIMSPLQNNNERLVYVYREYIKLACFITFPISFLVALLAKPFVLFVLTEKWYDCIIFIQLFSISSLFYAANSVNLNLLQVYGRSDYTLKSEIIKKAIGLLSVFLVLREGIIALAIVGCTMNVLSYAINLYYAKKVSGLSYFSQMKDVIPLICICIIMSIPVYIIVQIIDNSIVVLFLGSVTGLLIYSLLAKFLIKFSTIEYLKKYIKR